MDQSKLRAKKEREKFKLRKKLKQHKIKLMLLPKSKMKRTLTNNFNVKRPK